MRSLTDQNYRKKVTTVHLINYIIHGPESVTVDVIARLETTLLSFASMLIVADGGKADGGLASPRSSDSLQKLVFALKAKLLRRFQENPSAVVDHLLKAADLEMVCFC